MPRSIRLLKRRSKKPRVWAFLGFLVLSFIIWCMITLSGRYASNIALDIAYVNVPEEQILLGAPRSDLQANVSATGFRLLKYKLLRSEVNFNVSAFHKQGDRYYMSRDEMQGELRDQLEGLEVRRVMADTVWVDLGVNRTKKVKVVADTDISFQEDFGFLSPVTITPDSIELRGPEDLVSQLDSVTTARLVLKGVKEGFEQEVKIVLPDSLDRVELLESTVVMQADVARFSEKILEVPITVINIPEGVNIKVFPPVVRLLCKASMEDLKRLVPSGFRVVCDYNEITLQTTHLLPRIAEKPSFVQAATLLDNKVEFLINRS